MLRNYVGLLQLCTELGFACFPLDEFKIVTIMTGHITGKSHLCELEEGLNPRYECQARPGIS